MRGRSRLRTRGRTGSNSLLSRATALLGTAPLHYWDFTTNRALFNGVDVGAVTATPNWSFTRASTGYAQTVADTLTAFASGELRRTDKGVLIEGAGTNFCRSNIDMTASPWSDFSAGTTTRTANYGVAPDGTTTATRLQGNNANTWWANGYIAVNWASTTTTFSIWLKATATPTISMKISLNGGASYSQNITLTTSWARYTFTQALGAGDTQNITCAINHGSGNDIQAWGSQLEQASFASSTIPNTSTSASATRAADVLTVSSPGVTYPLSLFAEFERVVAIGVDEYLLQVEASGTERSFIALISNTAGGQQIATSGINGNASVAGTAAVGSVHKIAARFSLNNMQAARAGILATVDTTADVPTTPTLIRFAAFDASLRHPFGYLRRVGIFNSALADAALQRATT